MPARFNRGTILMEKTIYSKKRNATRQKIDDVFIESFRSSGSAELTVKEICEKAGINRSTFYVYYKDTDDMREQIESRLITQFEKAVAPVIDLDFDNSAGVTMAVMEFNRENSYLPMLLISAGSISFVYKISNAVTKMIADPNDLTEDDRERITMLFTYHFAGMSMVMRQMKENRASSDANYEHMAQKLVELILPVVKNGILPAIKELY